MIFNKKIQYGVLFTLYLSRAGRTTVDIASENLGLSEVYLNQIARKLRLNGVIKSIRGPGGGYELVGDPTVKDVFRALGGVPVVKQRDLDNLNIGTQEQRALAQYTSTVKIGMALLMELPVKSLITQSVNKEVSFINKLDSTALAS